MTIIGALHSADAECGDEYANVHDDKNKLCGLMLALGVDV